MSLPWNAQQIEWLQALGLEVLQRPAVEVPDAAVVATTRTADGLPAGLARAAHGVDLAPLLATHGLPRDVATRRTFWRALRPARKAMRRP